MQQHHAAQTPHGDIHRFQLHQQSSDDGGGDNEIAVDTSSLHKSPSHTASTVTSPLTSNVASSSASSLSDMTDIPTPSKPTYSQHKLNDDQHDELHTQSDDDTAASRKLKSVLHTLYHYPYFSHWLFTPVQLLTGRRRKRAIKYQLAYLTESEHVSVGDQQQALSVLAMANHIYVIGSFGYAIANGLTCVFDIDDSDSDSADLLSQLYLTSALLFFFMGAVNLLDAFLYYYVLLIQAPAVEPEPIAIAEPKPSPQSAAAAVIEIVPSPPAATGLSRAGIRRRQKRWYNAYWAGLSWETAAETLNIGGCLFYMLSGILGLPLAGLAVADAFQALDLDRIGNVCDNTAMIIFVVDSFLYMHIWSTYQPSHSRWWRSRDRDADFWAQAMNMFGGFAYLAAVAYGAWFRHDAESMEDWESELRVGERRQQQIQFFGDMIYTVGSLLQEVAFYRELNRVETTAASDTDSVSSDEPIRPEKAGLLINEEQSITLKGPATDSLPTPNNRQLTTDAQLQQPLV